MILMRGMVTVSLLVSGNKVKGVFPKTVAIIVAAMHASTYLYKDRVLKCLTESSPRKLLPWFQQCFNVTILYCYFFLSFLSLTKEGLT